MDELDRMAGDLEGAQQSTRTTDIMAHGVRELVRRKPTTVAPGTALTVILETMVREGIGCVLVTEGDRLVGILTERDILVKVAAAARPSAGLCARDLMTANPETLHPDQMVATALNRMSVGGYRHVPVVDDRGAPVGVVSVKDIVRLIVDHFPHEVLTQPPSGVPPFRSADGA
jgi:CBS domain-containing protein